MLLTFQEGVEVVYSTIFGAGQGVQVRDVKVTLLLHLRSLPGTGPSPESEDKQRTFLSFCNEAELHTKPLRCLQCFTNSQCCFDRALPVCLATFWTFCPEEFLGLIRETSEQDPCHDTHSEQIRYCYVLIVDVLPPGGSLEACGSSWRHFALKHRQTSL